MNDINLVKIDWISILSFGLLILLGLGNIFSSSQAYSLDSIFSLNPFSKQLIFVILSIFIFVFVQLLPINFFIKYSSILYVFSILTLLGLFLLEKKLMVQQLGFNWEVSAFNLVSLLNQLLPLH